ncbi:MAG: hypothetical protein Q8N14_05735 [Candidatus Omnitrophota bacterium]|nr:hypothetical protein [Candidatus Omnitrophota bacterium]
MLKPFITGLLISGIIFIAPALAQEETSNRKMQTIKGQIVGMDSMASTVTVRWFQNDFDEIVINIPLSCEIQKGSEKIELQDLNFRDEVSVDFYGDGFTGLKAVRITVTRSQNINYNY